MRVLDIKEAVFDSQNMDSGGEQILESLQNPPFPIIDLIVRESIQNGLDAKKDEAESVKFDFYHKKFDGKRLATYFEKIEADLIEKCGQESELIAFSDRNTTGLVGSYDSTDSVELEKSNFQKLIFNIGQKQREEGSGGSWGLGKTSYYKIGVGLVVYYTRIQLESGTYEERLVASVIENQHSDDKLLKDNQRGIAWWGLLKKDGSNKILPVTNHEDIKEILDVCGLEPYSNDETGTMIVIPYVKSVTDSYKLTGIWEHDPQNLPYWKTDYTKAIEMAVKRWYFPRLQNKTYSKVFDRPFLDCAVNGVKIKKTELEPLFEIYQSLYNAAITNSPSDPSIHVEEIINTRNIVTSTKIAVGRVAFTELTHEELAMVAPENIPSPHKMLEMHTNEGAVGGKILAYARKAGMVVNYLSENSGWLPARQLEDEGNFLIAFFVPNSDEKANEKLKKETIDEFFRGIENANHDNWPETNAVVAKIARKVHDLILNEYTVSDDNVQTSVSNLLAKRFGSLLPKTGKRGHKTPKPTSPTGTRTDVNRKNDISIRNVTFEQDGLLKVTFEAFIRAKTVSKVNLAVVQAQGTPTNGDDWEKTVGSSVPFPFEINKVSITEEKFGKQSVDNSLYQLIIDPDTSKSTFKFETETNPLTLFGKILIQASSDKYELAITIHSSEKRGDE